MQPTLNPVEIQSLAFLTRQQAQIYCAMDDTSFRKFILRRGVPYSSDDPSSPKSKRRFARVLLEKAMLADMAPAASGVLDEHAAKRVQQIMGDER
jgi:hypothetical protein